MTMNPGFTPGDVVLCEPFNELGVIMWCLPTYAELRFHDGMIVQCSYIFLKMRYQYGEG